MIRRGWQACAGLRFEGRWAAPLPALADSVPRWPSVCADVARSAGFCATPRPLRIEPDDGTVTTSAESPPGVNDLLHCESRGWFRIRAARHIAVMKMSQKVRVLQARDGVGKRIGRNACQRKYFSSAVILALAWQRCDCLSGPGFVASAQVLRPSARSTDLFSLARGPCRVRESFCPLRRACRTDRGRRLPGVRSAPGAVTCHVFPDRSRAVPVTGQEL